MTLRNQHVKPEDLFFLEITKFFDRKNRSIFGEDLFFFGDHLISTEKTVRILVKTFFFGDRLIWTEKTVRILVKTFFFWR